MSAQWGETVAATLYPVPDSEESEGGFEAATMGGVPHGVIVSGGDMESKEAALDHLCRGLEAFGFRGRVAVHDVTAVGHSQEYEVEVT